MKKLASVGRYEHREWSLRVDPEVHKAICVCPRCEKIRVEMERDDREDAEERDV